MYNLFYNVARTFINKDKKHVDLVFCHQSTWMSSVLFNILMKKKNKEYICAGFHSLRKSAFILFLISAVLCSDEVNTKQCDILFRLTQSGMHLFVQQKREEAH